MDKINLGYSLKNIPVPRKHNYLLDLTAKTEEFLRRMRWKAHFFLDNNNKESEEKTEKFGFNSQRSPPSSRMLDKFEEEIMDIIKYIKFSNKLDNFQEKLRMDTKEICKSEKIFVKADKSRNIYRITPELYKKLLRENITKTYKLDTLNTEKQINNEAYNITQKLNIADRVGAIHTKEAYVLMKDHKTNFKNKRQARLINPTKTETGRIAKVLLQKINKDIIKTLKLNQWGSTRDAIRWFDNLNETKKATFIQFDIVDFYPSITKMMLMEAIDFAKQHTKVTDEDKEIILHCRKSILRNNGKNWVKKSDYISPFDVAMGSFDSAQVSDLIGLYILNTLSRFIDKKDIGLYRDDGLMIVRESNGPKTNRIHKKIARAFKSLGFKVEIKSNLKIVDFLDLTLNLNNKTFKPFLKEGQTPLYINIKSNHPPNILKQIPTSINKRIVNNSSNKEIFNEVRNTYKNALKNSGLATEFNYEKNKVKNRENKYSNKNRSRKCIWFNPPYCKLVRCNIGKKFLDLVDKHFPKNNPLNKIFNRNTIKISYSCSKNMDRIINTHNQKLLNRDIHTTQINKSNCNCKVQEKCPLEKQCLIKNIIYKATIRTKEEPNRIKYYIGASKTKWKNRFYNHNMSFKQERYRSSTTLSKYIWEIKEKGLTPEISWEILKKTIPPTNFRAKCLICLEEKFNILTFPHRRELLNSRKELIVKCRHKENLKLKLN